MRMLLVVLLGLGSACAASPHSPPSATAEPTPAPATGYEVALDTRGDDPEPLPALDRTRITLEYDRFDGFHSVQGPFIGWRSVGRSWPGRYRGAAGFLGKGATVTEPDKITVHLIRYGRDWLWLTVGSSVAVLLGDARVGVVEGELGSSVMESGGVQESATFRMRLVDARAMLKSRDLAVKVGVVELIPPPKFYEDLEEALDKVGTTIER
jgi:hypothetical protein